MTTPQEQVFQKDFLTTELTPAEQAFAIYFGLPPAVTEWTSDVIQAVITSSAWTGEVVDGIPEYGAHDLGRIAHEAGAIPDLVEATHASNHVGDLIAIFFLLFPSD